MKSAIINIKTDPVIKTEASKLAKELGLSLSQVIHIALSNFVQSGSITASKTYTMSPELEKSLGKIEQDITKGESLSPTFTNAQEALQWLKKETE